jgi:hypothetical protein
MYFLSEFEEIRAKKQKRSLSQILVTFESKLSQIRVLGKQKNEISQIFRKVATIKVQNQFPREFI